MQSGSSSGDAGLGAQAAGEEAAGVPAVTEGSPPARQGPAAGGGQEDRGAQSRALVGLGGVQGWRLQTWS